MAKTVIVVAIIATMVAPVGKVMVDIIIIDIMEDIGVDLITLTIIIILTHIAIINIITAPHIMIPIPITTVTPITIVDSTY
jgi:hypothetical protein